ncbi:MAG: flagellar basal body-associated FliL family protein [Pontixanthobacter sp.]
MTNTIDPSDPPANKGGKLKLLIGAFVLLGAGAGAAYGASSMGYLGGTAVDSGPDLPQLVRKGHEDPYAVAAEGEGDDIANIDGEGGSEFRTSYYAFEETFTSNLRQSPALVQVSLAASTRYDGRVLMWLSKHDLALRSAILTVLADTPEDQVYSVEGKAKLQRRLTKTINGVLTEREGFGGVDNVYFLGFLVQ